MALTSPDGRYDQLYLSNYATINIIDQIKRSPAIGDVSLFTPSDYSMKVWLNTDRMTSFGMTPNDVANAIKRQNIQAAVGRIGAQPALPDQQFQLNIQTKGRLSSAEEFAGIVVRANPDGSFVRVRDIARVELGARSTESLGRQDGNPAVVLGIYQTPGGNALNSAENVRRMLAQLKTSFPEGVDYKITYDTTVFVSESIKGVVHTLVEAFVLVVLVVFLFLGNLRATMIPLIAVPVSLIGTFAAMLALGYSANTVTLLALVLAIGVVVDDAIVVVEAVDTELEKDPSLAPAEAANRAMGLITAPIIAITLVLLSVFVPVAFIPGISGELFRQFAVAVSVSMVISALNALTLSPALCAVFLRPRHGPKRGIMGYVLRGIDQARDGYALVVRKLVRLAVFGLVFLFAVMAGAGWLFKITPSGFLPSEDQGAVFAEIQLPEGASVNRTETVTKRVEEIARNTPGVASVTSVVGFSLIDGTGQIQQRPGDPAAQAVRRAQGPGAGRERHHPPADGPVPGHPGGHRFRLQPAADHRSRHRQRFRVPVAKLERRQRRRDRLGRPRPGVCREPESGAQPRVHHIQRQHAAALSRYRSREGADARHRSIGCFQRASGGARHRLRQRLQPVRPHLAGQPSGRGR